MSANADAVRRVDAYFARVRSALRGLEPSRPAAEAEEAVQDIRAYVLEKIADGKSAEHILAGLGRPEEIAAQCAEAADREQPDNTDPAAKRSPLSGRLLGVPYDFRPITAERTASRWWNPMNPHVFVPRLFGVGWTVNFAAIAVKLGLIRPDDEDVPFALVPRAALAAALVLPILLAAGLAVLAAVVQPGLPDEVPSYIARDGTAQQPASKLGALAVPAVMTAFGAALAVWTWARRRPPLSRAAAGALATSLACISITAYGQQAAAAHGIRGLAIVFCGVAAALALPFAMLVVLSRMGRAAEQKRDLGKTKIKGGSQ